MPRELRYGEAADRVISGRDGFSRIRTQGPDLMGRHVSHAAADATRHGNDQAVAAGTRCRAATPLKAPAVVIEHLTRFPTRNGFIGHLDDARKCCRLANTGARRVGIGPGTKRTLPCHRSGTRIRDACALTATTTPGSACGQHSWKPQPSPDGVVAARGVAFLRERIAVQHGREGSPKPGVLEHSHHPLNRAGLGEIRAGQHAGRGADPSTSAESMPSIFIFELLQKLCRHCGTAPVRGASDDELRLSVWVYGLACRDYGS